MSSDKRRAHHPNMLRSLDRLGEGRWHNYHYYSPTTDIVRGREVPSMIRVVQKVRLIRHEEDKIVVGDLNGKEFELTHYEIGFAADSKGFWNHDNYLTPIL